VFGGQVIDLPLRVGMRIGPASEDERLVPGSKHLTQLPGMLDRSRNAHRLVAAEHDDGGKSVLLRAIGVREAVVERMLGREERDDPFPRDVVTQIGDEMPEVVFLGRADRPVREKHVRPLLGQPLHRMICVNPRVEPFPQRELGARRPELGGDHRAVTAQRSEEIRFRHVDRLLV